MLRNRLRRLFSIQAIPSWLIIAWRIAEQVDSMMGIFERLQPVWQFLSSPLAGNILLLVGLVFLAFLLLKPLENTKPKPQKMTASIQRVPIVMSRGQLRTDDNTSAKLGRLLLEELTREKNSPRNFFQVHESWFGLYLDSVSGPHLLFRFAIRTSSLHTFEFLPQQTSGHIVYMKGDLARTPEVEVQTQGKLNREGQHMLAIKQFLEPNTVEHFRRLHTRQDVPAASFEFGGLNVYMRAYRPDGSVDEQWWKLPLPGAWNVDINKQDIRA